MKPILFNTEMVEAILSGRKTVTRRTAFLNSDIRKFPRPDFRGRAYKNWNSMLNSSQGPMSYCRYRKGDILYIRETWNYGFVETSDQPGCRDVWFEEADPKKCGDYIKVCSGYIYKAGLENDENWDIPDYVKISWRPSIHMPKGAARIFLLVTEVKLERLQNITGEGLIKEGTKKDLLYHGAVRCAFDYFADIWDRTVKPADRDHYGWDANPWVWVIEFKKIEKSEAMRYEQC